MCIDLKEEGTKAKPRDFETYMCYLMHEHTYTHVGHGIRRGFVATPFFDGEFSL